MPIVPSVEEIKCKFKDNTSLKVKREQIWMLPNFAQTDFSVQGCTRPFNPVDLRKCIGHQSVYTCLSRSSSLAGTLILHDFDEGKISSGASLDLRREMRELEILDDITRMRFENCLPASITGSNRRDLVTSYQAAFGARYVPKAVHPALDWRKAPNVELRPPSEAEEWKLVKALSQIFP